MQEKYNLDLGINKLIFRAIDYADWLDLTSFPCHKGSKVTVRDYITAGNVITFVKKSNTDHSIATGWVMEGLSKQDKPVETTINQTAAITIDDFTTQEKAINGFTKTWKIVGDSVNPLTLPETWLQINTLSFDNTLTNFIIAEVVSGEVLYQLHNATIAGTDSQSPQVLTVVTNSNGSKILVLFDEVVQGTSNFTYSGGTIATQLLIGNVAELTLTNPLIYGSSIGTLSGGSTITDVNNNALTALSNRTITNLVLNNIKSLAAGGVQLTGSGSKLQSATGSGGTDSPRTIEGWVFINNSSSQRTIFVSGHTAIAINADKRLAANMLNGTGGYVFKTSTNPLANGWNYFCCTFGTTKDVNAINIYIGNVLSNGASAAVSYTGGTTANTIALPAPAVEHQIDEIRIWNQVLGTTDRNNSYASGQVIDIRTTALYVANNNNLLYYNKFDDSIVDLSPSPIVLTGTPTYSTNIV